MPPPQTQLDPLPTLEMQPVDVQPAPIPSQQMAGQPLPTGAGFVSKAGAGAYIASNILTGWMAGRHMAQQKALERAKLDVTSAKQIYDTMEQSYRGVVDQGMTPEVAAKLQAQRNDGIRLSDEDEQRLGDYNKARQNVTAAWNNYLERAGKYSMPEPGQKRGVKKGLQQTFMGSPPELFVQKSLDVLKQGGAPGLMYGTSQAEREDEQIRQQRLEIGKQELARNQTLMQNDAHHADLQKQYEQAVDSKDQEKIFEAGQKLAAAGFPVPETKTREQREFEQKKAKAWLDGYDFLAKGGKPWDMPYEQQSAWGRQPELIDFYLQQVGPGKKYPNEIAAVNAWHRAEVAAQNMGGGRNPSQLDQYRELLRPVLQQELSTPEGAKKYNLVDANGKPMPRGPNDPVPDYILNKAVQSTLHPSPEDRAASKEETQATAAKGMNGAIKAALTDWNANRPGGAEFANKNFVTIDAFGNYHINPFIPETQHSPEKMWGLIGAKDTIAGKSVEDYNKERDDWLNTVTHYVHQVYPHLSLEQIKAAMGTNDPEAALAEESTKTVARGGGGGGGGAAGAQPPTPGSQPYSVSVGGGPTKTILMTPQQAETMKGSGPNVRVEPISTPPPLGGTKMPRY